MTIQAVVVIALTMSVCPASAQMPMDPPWNPAHISGLPTDIRYSVLAMCASMPHAAHYFATYLRDQVTLHFEYFHCDKAAKSYCDGTRCLHQVYKLTAGRYRLVKSVFGSTND